MPIFKKTLYWQQGNYGWSNVWYEDKASFAQARGFNLFLVNKWNAILNGACSVRAIRTQDVLDTRISDLVRFTLTDPLNATEEGELAATAVQLLLQSSAGGARTLWLRGLRDASITVNTAGVPRITETLTQEINRLGDQILESGWTIQKLRTASVVPWNPVIELVPSGNQNQLTTVFVADDTKVFPVGGTVYFRNAPSCDFPGLGGEHEVISSQAGSFDIRVRFPQGATALSFNNLFVREKLYDYNPITGYSIGLIRKRDTGRPFDLPRGRPRGRTCRI